MKWIIVTGDSGDLGNQIIKELLYMEDYGVIGLSRRNNDSIKELMACYCDRYFHIGFDLSHPEKIKKLYLEKIKTIGSIYGLINNSAYAYDDIVTNARISEIDKMYKINVISPIILTKYAIRDMLLHEVKGSIVNVSSVCAHTGYKGLSMYAATKGALEAFSKATAREWGEKGIRSNCIAPGFMDTNMSKGLSNRQKNRIYRRTSLKIATEVDSVAKTVAFLISEASKSISGTVVHVDNGTI